MRIFTSYPILSILQMFGYSELTEICFSLDWLIEGNIHTILWRVYTTLFSFSFWAMIGGFWLAFLQHKTLPPPFFPLNLTLHSFLCTAAHLLCIKNTEIYAAAERCRKMQTYCSFPHSSECESVNWAHRKPLYRNMQLSVQEWTSPGWSFSTPLVLYHGTPQHANL